MAQFDLSTHSLEPLSKTRDSWLSGVMGVECWIVSRAAPIESLASDGTIAGPAFLTAKTAAQDIGSVKQLTQLGFYPVDTALTFQFDSRALSKLDLQSRRDSSRWIVTDARMDDADSIGLIASRALTTSRFHLDPDIPSEMASAIKVHWARSLALGQRGIGCRVIRGDDGVMGFLGVVEIRRKVRTLAIDLIAVDPKAQGDGVGTALVRDFLLLAQAKGAAAQVGTQASNSRAARFYEGLGFFLTAATYVMHAHVSREEPS